MFLEYAVLSGFSGESAFDLEFILRMVAVFFFSLFLFFVGYYIKGIWGAVIGLILGTLFFLYERRVAVRAGTLEAVKDGR